MALSISRITPENLVAHQVSMANASDIVGLLAQLMNQGVQSTADDIPAAGGAPANWQIAIHQTGYVDQIANIEDWIIVGARFVLVYTSAELVQTFTADTPFIWSGVSTTPVATAIPGGTASLAFALPTSPNGPWTYSVQVTDSDNATSTDGQLVGDPKISLGEVTLNVGGLTAGVDYTFTITITADNYTDVEPVTSLPTATITALP